MEIVWWEAEKVRDSDGGDRTGRRGRDVSAPVQESEQTANNYCENTQLYFPNYSMHYTSTFLFLHLPQASSS